MRSSLLAAPQPTDANDPISPTSLFVEQQLKTGSGLRTATSASPASNTAGGIGNNRNSSSSSSSAAAGSVSGLGSNLMKSVNVLTPSGFGSSAQSMLQSSTPATLGARMHTMELLHYWASLDATKTMLSNLVAESLRSAGIAESPLAPSSGSAASSSSMSPSSRGSCLRDCYSSPQAPLRAWIQQERGTDSDGTAHRLPVYEGYCSSCRYSPRTLKGSDFCEGLRGPRGTVGLAPPRQAQSQPYLG